MTLASHLSPTILSASITQLAPLFMQAASGDEQACRDAVSALMADYKPQTNEELTLAADIVHYRCLAVDNLTRSSEQDLPLTKVLRLRGSAVSLSREAHKAQRKLDKLQASRSKAIADPASCPASLPEADQPEPTPRSAADTVLPAPPSPAELAALHAARDILSGARPVKTSQYGGLNYGQQLNKRVMVQTMKENAVRNAAETARRTTKAVAVPAT